MIGCIEVGSRQLQRRGGPREEGEGCTTVAQPNVPFQSDWLVVSMPFLEQTQGFAAPDGHVSAPSLFELLMQEQMEKGVKPAIEYVLHTLCESLPNLACALPVRRLDESYALLQCWMQSYFLARYDCLATEKFFGMKRVMLKTVDGKSAEEATSGLTIRAKKLALLFAVGL